MRFNRWITGAVLLVSLGVMSTANAAKIKDVRVGSAPESTRVVLDLNGPVDHRVFTLANPARIVIDLFHSSLTHPLQLQGRRGFVKRVRTGRHGDDTVRVVLDLTQPVRPKSFVLSPNGKRGYRLVIDLLSKDVQQVVKQVPQLNNGGRDLVVVIDAGHGGKDPGAIGPDGVEEKDVVLAIALALYKDLKGQPGIHPVLTRDGDYFITLNQRRVIAHNAQADLFMSIHADSFRSPSVTGATVYVLSENGASDEIARRLAERENAADLVGGVSLANKGAVLRRVLLDLSQSAAITASTTLGRHLIHSLGKVTPMRKTTVQRAGFFVLKQPDIPSILVETAYISNPRQESKLNSSSYQHRMARALYAGVLDYFEDNPRPGTYLASHDVAPVAVPVRYVIGRGDTLSGIAQRYQVSLPALKRSNGLNTSMIQIGQVLTIPQ